MVCLNLNREPTYLKMRTLQTFTLSHWICVLFKVMHTTVSILAQLHRKCVYHFPIYSLRMINYLKPRVLYVHLTSIVGNRLFFTHRPETSAYFVKILVCLFCCFWFFLVFILYRVKIKHIHLSVNKNPKRFSLVTLQ